MKLPFIPHKRINKILCLVLFAMALAFLLIGGVYALLGDADMGILLCVPAAISGCFALLYAVLWAVYGKKEQTRQKKIERAAQLLAEPSDHRVTYHEFVLPRPQLIRTAKRRFKKISLALLVSCAVVFVILYGVLYLVNGFGGVGHLIITAVFCVLMALPGILVQYAIFRRYARKVPERILLFPGKLILDEQQISAKEIDHILISSFLPATKDTSLFYRKLILHTNGTVQEYTIDYRYVSEDAPHWSGYGELLVALQSWAEQNRVKLTIDYMN